MGSLDKGLGGWASGNPRGLSENYKKKKNSLSVGANYLCPIQLLPKLSKPYKNEGFLIVAWMPLGVPEGHPGGPWGDHMLPKSIKTNVFLIIEKNTKAYRYENIYKKAAKLLQTLNPPALYHSRPGTLPPKPPSSFYI